MAWTSPTKSTTSYTGTSKNSASYTSGSKNNSSYAVTTKDTATYADTSKSGGNGFFINTQPFLLAYPFLQTVGWSNQTKS